MGVSFFQCMILCVCISCCLVDCLCFLSFNLQLSFLCLSLPLSLTVCVCLCVCVCVLLVETATDSAVETKASILFSFLAASLDKQTRRSDCYCLVTIPIAVYGRLQDAHYGWGRFSLAIGLDLALVGLYRVLLGFSRFQCLFVRFFSELLWFQLGVD